jgi:hypothetical protein
VILISISTRRSSVVIAFSPLKLIESRWRLPPCATALRVFYAASRNFDIGGNEYGNFFGISHPRGRSVDYDERNNLHASIDGCLALRTKGLQ